jgi:hypothetical protein
LKNVGIREPPSHSPKMQEA